MFMDHFEPTLHVMGYNSRQPVDELQNISKLFDINFFSLEMMM